MNSEEQRGWKTNDTYHEHWLDDPAYDVAEDGAESVSRRFIACAILSVVLLAGVFLAGKWLEPPQLKVTIAPPVWRTLVVERPVTWSCNTTATAATANSSTSCTIMGR